MPISGKAVKSPLDSLFMFIVIVFAGTMAFAVLLSWRAQLLFNTEYVDIVENPHRAEKISPAPKVNVIAHKFI